MRRSYFLAMLFLTLLSALLTACIVIWPGQIDRSLYRLRLWLVGHFDDGVNWARLAAMRDALELRYADDITGLEAEE